MCVCEREEGGCVSSGERKMHGRTSVCVCVHVNIAMSQPCS